MRRCQSLLRPRCSSLLAALLLAVQGGAVSAAEPVASVRLYAMDCGRIDVTDMSSFADTGDYDGKSGTLSSPCFLIWHPKGTLLWDLGLGDKNNGMSDGPFRLTVAKTLASQLQAIGLRAADVKYLSFSHLHWDHTGNANDYPRATWLLNQQELSWATSKPTPGGVELSTFSAYKKAKVVTFEGDKDVFGDGSVRILRANGHTPGHTVLLVKLAKSGTVILSGDLYHATESRQERLVPVFNTDRADTLASMDRVERLVKTSHALFIIQHAPESVGALPAFPAFLE